MLNEVNEAWNHKIVESQERDQDDTNDLNKRDCDEDGDDLINAITSGIEAANAEQPEKTAKAVAAPVTVVTAAPPMVEF